DPSVDCRACVLADSLCLLILTIHIRPPPISTLFPYTTLFRSGCAADEGGRSGSGTQQGADLPSGEDGGHGRLAPLGHAHGAQARSEEHTSELQSRFDLVCRLLLEKKKLKQAYKKI